MAVESDEESCSSDSMVGESAPVIKPPRTCEGVPSDATAGKLAVLQSRKRVRTPVAQTVCVMEVPELVDMIALRMNLSQLGLFKRVNRTAMISVRKIVTTARWLRRGRGRNLTPTSGNRSLSTRATVSHSRSS